MIRTMEYQEGHISLPVYDANSLITNGQALIWGTDASATSVNSMIDCAAALPIDIFAVASEGLTTTASNVNTPLIYQVECQMVTNAPIWRIYQDLATGTDLSVTSGSSTAFVGAAADDDPLDGCWIYINSGTGVGQLRFASTQTSTTAFTLSSALTTTLDTDTDYILIRSQGLPDGGQDLNTTLDKLVSVSTATGQIMILKNFIQSVTGTLEMDITKNPQLGTADNLNSRGVRFFSHIIFLDRALSTPSVVNAS